MVDSHHLDPNIQTMKCTYDPTHLDKDPHNHMPHHGMPKICNSIFEAIGNTPLVRLNKIPKEEGLKCEILVKCEHMNPCGSVKDRIGLRMLQEAEREGRLKPGDTVIECSSGNTGIAVAMACALKGYPLYITLPDRMSNEKSDMMKALGATVIRTPSEAKHDSPDSYRGVANRLRRDIPNSVFLDQYNNLANCLAHYDTTGIELVEQCDGKIDVFVAGAGTGGTVSGAARRIKEKVPGCKVVSVDTFNSVLAMPQSLNDHTERVQVEGLGKDYVPKCLDRQIIDKWYKVADKDSFPMTRRLIRDEGIFCGGSSGSAVWSAIQYAKENNLGADTRIVVLLPDNLSRYMTKLLSKEWMVENQYYDVQALSDPTHVLNQQSIEKLNLPSIKPQAKSLTINEAIQIFKSGQKAIPIVENGQVFAVVYQDKLMEHYFNKQLVKEDSVSKVWSKEFCCLPYEKVDCLVLQKLLERKQVIFLKKTLERGEVEFLVATPMDLINLI